jgi:hypothetical protein
MPETTVDEDHSTPATEDDVRLSGELPAVNAKAKSRAMKR